MSAFDGPSMAKDSPPIEHANLNQIIFPALGEKMILKLHNMGTKTKLYTFSSIFCVDCEYCRLVDHAMD